MCAAEFFEKEGGKQFLYHHNNCQQVHKQCSANCFEKGQDPGSGQIMFCLFVVFNKIFSLLFVYFCVLYYEYLSDDNENDKSNKTMILFYFLFRHCPYTNR